MQTATADPLVGRLLEGRYRIYDRIASGGMSTVYASVDERLDRRVAVKVMSSALSADPKFTDRFAREARAAARLTHVNAVAVYDQGIDSSPAGHHVFLVMELVEGRTLRDLIRERHGRFTPAEAISIMEPVLSALSAAHRAGLVHRDVKPENILLSDDGLVKVADFGLARAVDADAASTRTGLMMGTVAYCAPEQIVHGRSDQRSDVYSAGIMLFELLTGRPPYQGDSAMNVAFQHVHSRVPAPSSRVKTVPTPIDEIVVAATDSDPDGRPADASAFLAEVADTRSQLALPIVAIPPRPRPRPADGRRPNGRTAGDLRDGQRPDGYQLNGDHAPGTTAPVGAMGAVAGQPTEVFSTGYGRYDTEVVQRQPGPQVDAPPPPLVIPPSKRGRAPSPRARRRRRRFIMLIAFLLIGALSVAGGIAGVRKWREWNTRVPKVAGFSVSEAQTKLHKIGYAIDPKVTDEFSETVGKGVVIRTDPVADTRIEQGKPVRLIVSLGQDRVPMPDVVNSAVADAESTLVGRGLEFNPKYMTKHSITVASGSVISTSPAAGTRMRRSQQVSFVVSSGKPSVAIPSVVGSSYVDARRALKHANFKVERADDQYSDTVPSGSVISTSPTGQAIYGTSVRVTVSKGPQYVTIPTFPNLAPVADVEARLEQLGLTVVVKTFLGGKQGLVLQMSPSSNTAVQIGSAVTLTVV